MQTHGNKGRSRLLRGEAGFTLVEMMMAVLITGFVGAAILLAYQTQQHTQYVQEQIAELQANMRAAMTMISTDIRMIGFDPTCEAKAGIVSASQGKFQFTMNRKYEDQNEDGTSSKNTGLTDENEDITYYLDEKYDPKQVGVATVNSKGMPALQRIGQRNGTAEPVVHNVEAIEFLYKIGDYWYVNPDKSGKLVKDIEAVTISMLIRTSYEDPKYSGNNKVLIPASLIPDLFPNFKVQDKNNEWMQHVNSIKDHHRRRVAISTVQLRNRGLCKEAGL